MNKIKLLTIAVLVLLLLNLGTIGFLILGPKHRGHGEGPKKLIIEKLHLDEQQQGQYAALIRWHRSHIDALDREIHEAKNNLYLQLIKSQPDTQVKDSLITAIVGYQKQIETTHFKHFEDLKKLCRPEQMNYFNQLTKELSSLFSKPPRRKND
jgi:Spy/CpxP family protein refolding chaperone